MVVDTQTEQAVEKWAGIKLRSAAKIDINKGLFLTFYGQGGAGKSTLAASLVYSEIAGRGLHLNIEGNAQVLSHLPSLTIADIFKWDEARDIITEAKDRSGCPFGFIIVDNLSELQNLNVRHIKPDGGQVSQPQWGTSTAEMLEFIRDCRVISEKKGIHVILTAWNEHEKNETTGSVRNHVAFTPSLARQFPGVVPMIGLVKPNAAFTDRRLVDFTPDEHTDCKYGVSPIDTAKTIPYKIKYRVDDPVLADFLEAVRGVKPWPEDKYK